VARWLLWPPGLARVAVRSVLMPELKLVEVFDPAYLVGLDQIQMVELRAKRDICAELETELSYLRRLAQARIDWIMAESDRRDLGLSAPEPEALIEQLPQILAEHPRSGGPGRLPTLFAPTEVAQSVLSARLEAVCPSDQIEALDKLTLEQLEGLLINLSALESDVSSERRALHSIQDRLQEELVRRYRSGEATVDALLS
jgi:RsiG-like